MIRAFGYNIKQALVQIGRNRGMSIASIFAILAMLLVLGIFFVMTINLNLFIETVKQDYDQVEVYIQDGTSDEVINNDIALIYQQMGVEHVTYVTKDDALERLKERWGDSGYLLDSLGTNPLPASIIIQVESLDSSAKIAQYAGSLEGIDDVKFYQETVEKLTKITDYLQTGALIIMAFLIIVSVVIVSNTVKLTVFAREKEIFIMKYVGATNWFIRGPFLAEGIIIGLIGAVVSTGVVALVYAKLIAAIGDQVIAIAGTPLISVEYMTINLFIIFITLGVAIGSWGSIISMRKFLDT